METFLCNFLEEKVPFCAYPFNLNSSGSCGCCITLLQATEVTEKTLLELHCDKSELFCHTLLYSLPYSSVLCHTLPYSAINYSIILCYILVYPAIPCHPPPY